MIGSSSPIRILILYSEVMPYTLGVIQEMSKRKGIQVVLVFWDQSKLTPFSFEPSPKLQVIPRSELSWELIDLTILEFDPTHIWTSGRMDPLYLEINLRLKKRSSKIVRISGCDNQWEGTIKDHVKSLLGYWLYRRYFDFFWIPGPKQREFARRVGFNDNQILPNLLSCSQDWFRFKSPLDHRRILFVGRLVPNKNIQTLIDAFEGLPWEISSNLYLRIIGSGDKFLFDISHPNIEFYPFESQEKLILHGLESDLFCLPSIHEPFGVVVHEFAALGLPLALSKKVGACPVFLEEGGNGFSFSPDNTEELKTKLIWYYALPQGVKKKMGEKSIEMAKLISPAISVDSFLSSSK